MRRVRGELLSRGPSLDRAWCVCVCAFSISPGDVSSFQPFWNVPSTLILLIAVLFCLIILLRHEPSLLGPKSRTNFCPSSTHKHTSSAASPDVIQDTPRCFGGLVPRHLRSLLCFGGVYTPAVHHYAMWRLALHPRAEKVSV